MKNINTVSEKFSSPSCLKNVGEGSCSCSGVYPDYLDSWRKACHGSGTDRLQKNIVFSTFVEDFRLIWDFISYKSVKTMKQTKNHSTCLYSDVTVVPLQQIVNLIWRQMQIVSSYKTVFRPCINVILNFLFFIDRRNVWSNPVPQWSRWLLFSTA